MYISVNPTINPSGYSLTYDENDTFKLNITITGIPKPDVTWLKDNANFITKLTGVMASFSGLQVTNAQYETAGRYSVQATNCADTDLQIYNIFIRCKLL